VICPPEVIEALVTQPVVIPELVQAVAEYEPGVVPDEPVKVTVSDPAVVP
jgi:hypothetical protein